MLKTPGKTPGKTRQKLPKIELRNNYTSSQTNRNKVILNDLLKPIEDNCKSDSNLLQELELKVNLQKGEINDRTEVLNELGKHIAMIKHENDNNAQNLLINKLKEENEKFMAENIDLKKLKSDYEYNEKNRNDEDYNKINQLTEEVKYYQEQYKIILSSGKIKGDKMQQQIDKYVEVEAQKIALQKLYDIQAIQMEDSKNHLDQLQGEKDALESENTKQKQSIKEVTSILEEGQRQYKELWARNSEVEKELHQLKESPTKAELAKELNEIKISYTKLLANYTELTDSFKKQQEEIIAINRQAKALSDQIERQYEKEKKYIKDLQDEQAYTLQCAKENLDAQESVRQANIKSKKLQNQIYALDDEITYQKQLNLGKGGPTEQDSVASKAQIKQISSELESFRESNADLKLIIKQLKIKEITLENTIHQIHTINRDKERKFTDMIELNTQFENNMNVLKARDANFSQELLTMQKEMEASQLNEIREKFTPLKLRIEEGFLKLESRDRLLIKQTKCCLCNKNLNETYTIISCGHSFCKECNVGLSSICAKCKKDPVPYIVFRNLLIDDFKKVLQDSEDIKKYFTDVLALIK